MSPIPARTEFASTLPPVSRPQSPQKNRWRLDTFRSLRHPNYRLYFTGQLISVLGSWVQTTALTWLAWERTQESTWTALIAAMQMLPTAVLGVWGGSLADRLPKRTIIFATQSGLLVLSLILAALVYSGQDNRWTLLAAAIAIGLVNAIDLPTRLAFVVDMVGRDDLMNAVALNSLLFNVARATGPALGAFLLRWLGAGHCFVFNGLTFVAVLAALLWMDVPLRPPVERRDDAWTALVGGFVFFFERRGLLLVLALSAALAFLAWPMLALLPAVSDRQLHTGTDGYGWMLSAVGVGALLAALTAASFGSLHRRQWFLGAGVVATAAALLGLGTATTLTLGLLWSMLAGYGMICYFVTAQSIVQLSATDEHRGRVMGVWSMITSGALPLGNLLLGWAADRWGVALALSAAGGAIVWIAVMLAGVAVVQFYLHRGRSTEQ
jgi:MFS family permease